MKIIVCHLGNGASVSAVDCGKSVDTSMGLTPLEGLVMGTRSGDIDPAILEYVGKKENKNIDQLMEVLNKEIRTARNLLPVKRRTRSGGCGGRRQCEGSLALDIFDYRVIKYVGAYAAVMNGVDAIRIYGRYR